MIEPRPGRVDSFSARAVLQFRSRRSSLRVAGAVIAGLLATVGVSWARSETREACRVDGVNEIVRCLSVQVPESAANPSGRTLRIAVVVLPARGPAPHREPLLLIQG